MRDGDIKDEIDRLLHVPPGTFWIHKDGGPVCKVRGLEWSKNEKRWKLIYHTVAGGSGYSSSVVTFLKQWVLVINPETLKPPTSCREVHKMEGF